MDRHKDEGPQIKEQNEYSVRDTQETKKQYHTNQNSQHLLILEKNRMGEGKTESLLKIDYVLANVTTESYVAIQITEIQARTTFPPITLIDELEHWDDDQGDWNINAKH